MIDYLIELALIHMLLFIAYHWVLRQEYDFRAMRFYLLGITIIALLVPLLKSPEYTTYRLPGQDVIGQLILEPAVAPISSNPQLSIGYMDIIIMIYGLVTTLFLINIILPFLKIIRLRSQSRRFYFNDQKLFIHAEISGSFNFFNWIFVDQSLLNDERRLNTVITHEMAHLALKHSWDLLYLHLFRAFFWWLPSAWISINEIKKLHEYQADDWAIRTIDSTEYSKILISTCLQSHGLRMASSFYDGLIIKRLNAMKQNVKKLKRWKVNLTLTISLITIIAFSCNEDLGAEIKAMEGNTFEIMEVPPIAVRAIEKLQIENPDKEYKYIALMGESATKREKWEAAKAQGLVAATITGDKEGMMGIILEKGSETYQTITEKLYQEQASSQENVFTVVESQPEYRGGMDAFYTYINDHLVIPDNIKKQTGRVYVQFVVGKEGNIRDVKVLKGLNEAYDKIASEVITNAPDFIPGTQNGKKVAVRMVIPIIFE